MSLYRPTTRKFASLALRCLIFRDSYCKNIYFNSESFVVDVLCKIDIWADDIP